jgi:hypothetical protein
MLTLHTRTFWLVSRAVASEALFTCATPALADWVKFASGGWARSGTPRSTATGPP